MAYGRKRAAAGGSALLEKVRSEARDGWVCGLTVLTGEDLYHLDAAQRSLLEALIPEGSSEFGLTVFGESKVDGGVVVGAARSAGMFSERRVVLVRDVASLEGDAAALVEYASDPPHDSFLLIRAPKLDRRRKLHQALAKHGRLVEFPAPDVTQPAAFGTEVVAMARSKGLQIDRETAGFLAEICSGDLYRVASELEKLRCWLGSEGGKVTPQTIREVASQGGVVTGWEVADAVLQRDTGQALRAIRRALEAGQEPLQMLGGLSFRSRGMLQAKSMIVRGTAPASAFRAARLFGDTYDRMARGLERYTLDELLCFPSYLLEADSTLKSRAISASAVLESLVDRMTGASR